MEDVQDSMDTAGRRRGCLQYRWIVAINCFFALCINYTLRLDLSVAIVCMVKSTNDSSAFKNNTASPDRTNTTVQDERKSRDGCEFATSRSTLTGQEGEFEWSKEVQAELLASFFYGYLTTQILGGWLARRYGTRKVLGLSMVVAILATFITPVSARTHVYVLFAVRLVAGISLGMVNPAVFNLSGRWAPPLEKSRFLAICLAGFPLGYVVAFSISGVLCAYGFDRGWGSIFYTFGISATVCVVCWFYFVYDTPTDHPRISNEERKFIERKLGKVQRVTERKQATPWLSIVTSPAFWAVLFATFGDDWVNYTLQLGLIVYTKEVLHYDIAQNGILSSLPFIVSFVSGFFVGFLVDFVQRRRLFSTVNTRRLFQCVGYTGMGAFITAMGFISCEERALASVFLTMSMVFKSCSRGGLVPNMTEFAPRYAGEIAGMLLTMGTIPGFVSPLVIGLLTPNGTQDEWQNVFYVSGAVSFVSVVGFAVFVRSDVQSWAKTTDMDDEITHQMVPVNSGSSTHSGKKFDK